MQLFNPQKFLVGRPAKPECSWHMLATALLKEVMTSEGEDVWKAALIENECMSVHKLVSASHQVKTSHLQLILRNSMQEIICCSEC